MATDPSECRTYARWGSIIISLLLLFGWMIPFFSYDLFTDPAGWLGFVIGIVLATLEMPFICSCDPCKKASTALHIFESYWLRGFFYIALATLGGFVNFHLGWSDRVSPIIRQSGSKPAPPPIRLVCPRRGLSAGAARPARATICRLDRTACALEPQLLTPAGRPPRQILLSAMYVGLLCTGLFYVIGCLSPLSTNPTRTHIVVSPPAKCSGARQTLPERDESRVERLQAGAGGRCRLISGAAVFLSGLL